MVCLQNKFIFVDISINCCKTVFHVRVITCVAWHVRGWKMLPQNLKQRFTYENVLWTTTLVFYDIDNKKLLKSFLQEKHYKQIDVTKIISTFFLFCNLRKIYKECSILNVMDNTKLLYTMMHYSALSSEKESNNEFPLQQLPNGAW